MQGPSKSRRVIIMLPCREILFKSPKMAGGACSYPVLKKAPSGYWITWIQYTSPNNRRVYLHQVDNQGSPVGDVIPVTGDNLTPLNIPSLAVSDSSGNFVIAWRDSSSGDPGNILARQFNPDGSFFGNEYRVNSDSGIALAEGTGGGVRPQRPIVLHLDGLPYTLSSRRYLLQSHRIGGCPRCHSTTGTYATAVQPGRSAPQSLQFCHFGKIPITRFQPGSSDSLGHIRAAGKNPYQRRTSPPGNMRLSSMARKLFFGNLLAALGD